MWDQLLRPTVVPYADRKAREAKRAVYKPAPREKAPKPVRMRVVAPGFNPWGLTPMQMKSAQLTVAHRGDRAAAAKELGICENTIHSHLGAAQEKMKVSGTGAVIAEWLRVNMAGQIEAQRDAAERALIGKLRLGGYVK
jgi:DNA-binding CsgD family transcriptional regulator